MSATEEIPTYVWTDPGQLGAYLYPEGVVELLLEYWVPGRVSVSSDHDYYPSWK